MVCGMGACSKEMRPVQAQSRCLSRTDEELTVPTPYPAAPPLSFADVKMPEDTPPLTVEAHELKKNHFAPFSADDVADENRVFN